MEQLLVVRALPVQVQGRCAPWDDMLCVQQADVLQHEPQEGFISLHAEQAYALQHEGEQIFTASFDSQGAVHTWAH